MVKKISKKERLKERQHKARRISIKEGIFAAGKMSFGDHYISPFAIAINTSNSMVAMLSSVAGLLGPLSQTFSSRLIEKHSRKKIVLKAVFIESLFWLPLVLIAFLFYRNLLTGVLPIILLSLYGLYIIVANIAGPAWFSWMGDIVDEEWRGRWFSKRNLIIGFVSVILTIFAAIFLDYFKKDNLIMVGFMFLFLFAFLFRFNSWRLFKKQYEPKLKLKKGYYFSFWEFLIQSPKNNFGRFSLFKTAIGFSVSVSTPLVAVYLLRNLGFSYIVYMTITLAGTLFSLSVLQLWGKFADRYGNYRTLAVSCIIVPFIPLLWIANPHPIYLILIPSLLGGIAWAGFNLAAGNFVYDSILPKKRAIAVSYYNLLHGIGVFLGAGLGAILIKYIHTESITPIFVVFIIGSVLRFLVIVIFLPQFKEVRKTKKFKSSRVFKNIILKQAKPTLIEEIHQISSIKEYLRE